MSLCFCSCSTAEFYVSSNIQQKTRRTLHRQIQNIVDFSSNVMSSLLGDKVVHSGVRRNPLLTINIPELLVLNQTLQNLIAVSCSTCSKQLNVVCLSGLQEVVRLPLEFVRQLSIKIQHQRPAWRCDKVMDIYSGCALCLPNLTSPTLHQPTPPAPPLCIEIKPKCGFLPSPKHVSKDIKTRVCRYCMHQHYKVEPTGGQREVEETQSVLSSGPVLRGGQCIYSSKEGSNESPDMNSLLHHLRPYFLHGNNRINGHMTTKAVLNDVIQ
ncbi:hypothetical protein GOODEAATRI_021136, partial [Goodea atripinnis]